jgi:DNA-binding transcriptional regulator LsrR (DeoR family)
MSASVIGMAVLPFVEADGAVVTGFSRAHLADVHPRHAGIRGQAGHASRRPAMTVPAGRDRRPAWVEDTEHLRLLAKVARLYHEQGMKQREIAAALSISQPRVSRLLTQAVSSGLVRSVIVLPPGVHTELEDRVRQRYGLRDVVVVDAAGAGIDVTAALGAAAAYYLDTTLMGGEVIGISSWSGSLLAAVDRMRPATHAPADRVVQLFGGLGQPEVQVQATRLTSRLAELTGARPVFLPAPAVAGQAATRDAFMVDPSVAGVVQQWSDVDVALVGVGSLSPSPLLRSSGNGLSEAEQQDLRELGAVGDVCLRFFDGRGAHVASAFDSRVIGIGPEELRAVSRRIAVAGGVEKAGAITAAVRGGWANVLITDHEVAVLLDTDR